MRTRVAIVALIAVVASNVLLARGNAKTVRLDVSGGDLRRAISITNQNLLDLSHVYAAQFLGDLVQDVDSQWPRYMIRLVFEPQIPSPDPARNRQRSYVIYYSLNWQTGDGYVYLPGRGEAAARDNAGVIIRDGHDGRWHHATSDWSALLNPYLH